ncbi:MAG: HAMP domain-containing sensor histidine kinase [Hespellia sp.]|nr:HAMP domain-containing sensor histidine kinase [Hespellia sp.]
MKHKEHLKRFWKDHVWVVVLFLTVPVACFFLYGFFQNTEMLDLIYYCAIDIIGLILVLTWRLYVTWRVYELYGIDDSMQMDDFQISKPRSNQEKEVQKLLQKIKLLNYYEIKGMEEERREQKLMIYQWIHQIKTPLSVMKLLMGDHVQNEEYVHITSGIRQIEYHLNQIIYIYELDAVEHEFKAERVNLYEVCKKSINELKEYFISNQVYPKLCVEKDIEVYSDTKWLEIMLYQLLTNAVKYSEAGSSVTLTVSGKGERVALSIKDQGMGISDADKERIFRLFFVGRNGRETGESSGIGLYIVKHIAYYLGHGIEVESKLGEGSVFSIIFENRKSIMDRER